MTGDQEFKISVGGYPKTEFSLGSFRRQTHQSILKIDPEVEIEERNFARINYQLEWSGIVKDVYYLTTANRRIIEYAKKYLNKWTYNIKIKIEEKGDIR